MTTLPLRPGRDFAILRREMDRLFDNMSTTDRQTETVWSPRADVSESDRAYTLSLDLPGIDRDTLDVTLDDGTLKVSGERTRFASESTDRIHRVERAHGRFFRSFTLGTDLDPDSIEASYDDGVLTIEVGKSEIRKPRRIPVHSRSNADASASENASNELEEAELVEA